MLPAGTVSRVMRRALSLLFFAVVLAVVVPFAVDAESAPVAGAKRSLDDYRHFRIAAIDLLGRMPTRAELASFERSDFDFDKWIDAHLQGPAYVERLTRV